MALRASGAVKRATAQCHQPRPSFRATTRSPYTTPTIPASAHSLVLHGLSLSIPLCESLYRPIILRQPERQPSRPLLPPFHLTPIHSSSLVLSSGLGHHIPASLRALPLRPLSRLRPSPLPPIPRHRQAWPRVLSLPSPTSPHMVGPRLMSAGEPSSQAAAASCRHCVSLLGGGLLEGGPLLRPVARPGPTVGRGRRARGGGGGGGSGGRCDDHGLGPLCTAGLWALAARRLALEPTLTTSTLCSGKHTQRKKDRGSQD